LRTFSLGADYGDGHAGSIEDLQKQARELAAKKNSIQEVNSAQELLRSAECAFSLLFRQARHSKLKAAADTRSTAFEAASNEESAAWRGRQLCGWRVGN